MQKHRKGLGTLVAVALAAVMTLAPRAALAGRNAPPGDRPTLVEELWVWVEEGVAWAAGLVAPEGGGIAEKEGGPAPDPAGGTAPTACGPAECTDEGGPGPDPFG
jgi:hypothetical protein